MLSHSSSSVGFSFCISPFYINRIRISSSTVAVTAVILKADKTFGISIADLKCLTDLTWSNLIYKNATIVVRNFLNYESICGTWNYHTLAHIVIKIPQGGGICKLTSRESTVEQDRQFPTCQIRVCNHQVNRQAITGSVIFLYLDIRTIHFQPVIMIH